METVSSPPPAGTRALHTTVAVACAGAAALHFAYAPGHFGVNTGHGLFFVAVAWVQVAIAVLAVRARPAPRTALLGAAAFNLGVAAVWLVSRTAGISGEVEPVRFPDGLAVALELTAAVAAVAAVAGWLANVRLREASAGAWAGASAVAVAALVTASLAPSTGGGHDHGNDGGTEAAAAHAHGDAAGAAKGHTTGGGGAAAAEPAGAHGHTTDTSASAWEKERLKALMGGLSVEEVTAQREASRAFVEQQLRTRSSVLRALPADEAEARIKTYVDWQLAHALQAEHGDDKDGKSSGNHTDGPQEWKPLAPAVNAELQRQLKAAGTVIPKFPTAAEAMAGGYMQVTPWVPGIGAHYLNVGLTVDGRFDPTRPEMLLYNGNSPSSELVGVSYAVLGESPPEGFAGGNDTWHDHPSLCIVGSMVVGSDATPEALCDSVGGKKGAGFGTTLWMSHLWQVPGWESYWGLFSSESPAINLATTDVGRS